MGSSFLISHPTCSVSVLLGSHQSLASGSCLPLGSERPDEKLLSLRAQDGPSFAPFTLGQISMKLSLSLLLPSVTNSVCAESVFPSSSFRHSEQMIIVCFLSLCSLHQSLCSCRTRLLNVRNTDVSAPVSECVYVQVGV